MILSIFNNTASDLTYNAIIILKCYTILKMLKIMLPKFIELAYGTVQVVCIYLSAQYFPNTKAVARKLSSNRPLAVSSQLLLSFKQNLHLIYKPVVSQYSNMPDISIQSRYLNFAQVQLTLTTKEPFHFSMISLKI